MSNNATQQLGALLWRTRALSPHSAKLSSTYCSHNNVHFPNPREHSFILCCGHTAIGYTPTRDAFCTKSTKLQRGFETLSRHQWRSLPSPLPPRWASDTCQETQCFKVIPREDIYLRSRYTPSIIANVNTTGLISTRRFYSQRLSGEYKKPRPSSIADRVDGKHNGQSDENVKSVPYWQMSLKGVSVKPLRNHLPHISQIHRPSREELLAAATGFWSRLKVRFKWFSIRSARPFNVDEIGAFFSWFLLGHVLWIVLGTTTFFSLAILALNTVFAQETLARWVGNYLTRSSGVKVVFESAIVPKWRDGVITFKNVFVSRRPGQGNGQVSKGSPSTEAAAAATAVRLEKSRQSGEALLFNESTESEEEDTNYSQFDLSLDTINVTLSFTKWFNSKGLLQDVEIRGVRGVIDRTSVHYEGNHVDPRIYKHEHNPGDFEINSFKLEDLLVTVYQPNDFRPFSISVFSCELSQLRRQWLFYDFLSANTMHGSFDDSLFTIHPRQLHGHVGGQVSNGSEVSGEANPWKKHSRLRIDDLNIDHLNRGIEGPFSWIHKGSVDIVADIMFPAETNDSIAKIMSDFYDRMEATVSSTQHLQTAAVSSTVASNEAQSEIQDHVKRSASDDDNRLLVMDLRVHLSDIRAAVPLFTKDLSYVNNALVRPIVAYMNSRHTFIPINCRVVKRAREFDGSWTVFDSGLMDDLSAEVRCMVIRREKGKC